MAKSFKAEELEFDASELEFADAPASTAKPSAYESALNSLLDAAGIDSASLGSKLEQARQSRLVQAGNVYAESVAGAGRALNLRAQGLAGALAEGGGRAGAAIKRAGLGLPGSVLAREVRGAGIGAGTVLGTAAEYLLPQDKLGAALLPAEALGKLSRLGPSAADAVTGAGAAIGRGAKAIAARAKGLPIPPKSPAIGPGTGFKLRKAEEGFARASEALEAAQGQPTVIFRPTSERIDPETVAEALMNVQGQGLPASLTAAERRLAETAGERMVLAKRMGLRAREALNPEELASLNVPLEGATGLPRPRTRLENAPEGIQRQYSKAVDDLYSALRERAEAIKPKQAPAAKGATATPPVPEPALSPSSTFRQEFQLEKPTNFDKVMGEFLSAQSNVDADKAAWALRNERLLTDVPPTAEVSKMWRDAFKENNFKINPDDWRDIAKTTEPLIDTQTGRPRQIVNEALERLDSGEALEPPQAFIASQAANRLKRWARRRKDADYANWARAAEDRFDDIVANSKLPNIRDLKDRYWAAKVRDEFEAAFPQNITGGVNRFKMMASTYAATHGVADLLQGQFVQGASNLGFALASSPRVQGRVIKLKGALKGGARRGVLAAGAQVPSAGPRILGPALSEPPEDQE